MTDASTVVRAKGGRMTKQRRLVLEALEGARHHTTVEAIAQVVERTLPGIDRSTIYRNLEALEAAGLATHTHIDGRLTRWHRAESHVHGHLVCTTCGSEEEVDIAQFGGLVRSLRRSHGFDPELSHSAIAGTCRRCRTA